MNLSSMHHRQHLVSLSQVMVSFTTGSVKKHYKSTVIFGQEFQFFVSQ